MLDNLMFVQITNCIANKTQVCKLKMLRQSFASVLLTAKTFAALLGDFTATSPCTVGDEAYCTDFTSLNDTIHADLNFYHTSLDTHIADIVAHSDDSDSSHHHFHHSSHHHHDSSSDSDDSWSIGWSSDSWFGRDRGGTFKWDSSEERFVYDGYLLPESSDSESIDHSFAKGIYRNYLERRVHHNKHYGDRHKAEYSHIYSDDSDHYHDDHYYYDDHYHSDDHYYSDDYYTDDYYYSDHYFDDHHYDNHYQDYHYEPDPYHYEPDPYHYEIEPYHYEPEPVYHAPS